jgi:ferric-dicitrate binding protein FerR (iron transport regulator)
MNCEQAQSLISAQIDQEIAPPDRALLAEHLQACAGCQASAESIKALDADLRRVFGFCERSAVAVQERVLAQLRAETTPEVTRIAPAPPNKKNWAARLGWIAAVAASVLCGVLTWELYFREPGKRGGEDMAVVAPRPGTRAEGVPPPPRPNDAAPADEKKAIVDDKPALAAVTPPAQLEYRTARSRPSLPAATVAVGEKLQTAQRERRRVTLPDTSILYLNENTALVVDGERHLKLDAGEVYVEVAPRSGEEARFTVQTPTRKVVALGTKFDVAARGGKTDVLVTQSSVQVSGLEGSVHAGTRASDGLNKSGANVSAWPLRQRASQPLDWTRDLVVAAEAPLVPASDYAGGALIARDPNGQENRLSLRTFHIDVHIEDGFARTTIDQTYFNEAPLPTEGTFYFPLPPDASVSRLAMYVNGRLMEGGMAERDHARDVYETIRYANRDPALLEWMDGSTFKMRVFPLEPRQEKRIILSYTQRLETLYEHAEYRFPSGHSLQTAGAWSFHARIKGGAKTEWKNPTYELKASNAGSDLLLDAIAKNFPQDRDVVLELSDPLSHVNVARFSSAASDGAKYVMLRYFPTHAGVLHPQPKRRDWVFLFESSADRDPLLARVQIDVVRTLLDNAEHDDTFTILAAGTRVNWWNTQPQTATPDHVKAAVQWLERAHLIGALDLGQALAAAKPVLTDAANPWLVHVGSGIPALGERREDELVRRLPAKTKYVGVAVGKRWSRNFMKTAAENSGGYFTQINPDEPVAWRAFDLSATLNTPRLLDVKVVDNAEQVAFVPCATSIADGEEICAIARIEPATQPLPKEVTISGKLDGQPFVRVVKVEHVAEHADYLPRTWAKLEIDRLLAQDAEANKERIVALGKAMYVMTPYTSLLVLENQQDYEKFKIDLGRQDHWALYAASPVTPPRVEAALAKAATVAAVKPTAEQVRETVVVRQTPPVVGRRVEGNGNVLGLPPLSERQAFPLRIQSGASRGNFGGTSGGGAAKGVKEAEASDADKKPGDKKSSEEATKKADALKLSPSAGMPKAPAPGGAGGLPGPIPMPRGPDAPAKTEARPAAAPELRSSALPESHSAGSKDATLELQNRARGAALPPGNVQRAFEIPGNAAFQDLRENDDANVIQKRFGANPDRAKNLRGGPAQQLPADDAAKRDGNLMFQMDSRLGGVQQQIELLQQQRGGNEAFFARLNRAPMPDDFLYHRPRFDRGESYFTDLTAHASGMNTSPADVSATLEAEAAPEAAAGVGIIDAAARKMIDRARSLGWRSFPVVGGTTEYTVLCDGGGRYRMERRLADSLREVVVCDGGTLWQLYPELGIGARRPVSRFHRAELAELLPMILPPAEDLARGADLLGLTDNTVAIVPHGNPRDDVRSVHLVFDQDGRLSERRVVDQKSEKALSAESYQERWQKSKEAEAPSLVPPVNGLVVLPLPYRTPQYVIQKFNTAGKSYEQLNEDAALALFAAYLVQSPLEAVRLFGERFHTRGERFVGFYTLLASAGINVDQKQQFLNILAVHPQQPLAKYLAALSDPQRRQSARLGDLGGPADGFVQRLAAFRDLYRAWETGHVREGDEARRSADRDRALTFVHANRDSLYGWWLLSLLLDQDAGRTFARDLGDACRLFERLPELGYAARYEYARSFFRQAKYEEAKKAFTELFDETVAAGKAPLVDAALRQALLAGEKDNAPWAALVRRAAQGLAAQGKTAEIADLVRQCRSLGDPALAADLVDRLQRAATKEDSASIARADAFRRKQIADATDGKNKSSTRGESDVVLWRLAADLADEQRKAKATSLGYLERALDVEYTQLPAIVDLETVRGDYGRLLAGYHEIANALKTLDEKPSADLAPKVVRAADRWLSLETDPTAACQAAAPVLAALGDEALAWDYLTTPLALHPNEAAPLVSLAATVQAEGDLGLADRAYAAAFVVEPTNAQILWERSVVLRQAGRDAEAEKLRRQIAEGPWQPRFRPLQELARQQLGNR